MERVAFTPSPENPLYSVGTVATMFDVSHHQVRQWIRDGNLKAGKVNGQWRISKEECVRFANKEYSSGD